MPSSTSDGQISPSSGRRHEQAGGDRRWRVRRTPGGARAEIGAGRRDAHRSAQPSHLPAAALPGGNRVPGRGRGRCPLAEHLQAPEERARSARGSGGLRSGRTEGRVGGRRRVPVRRPDRRGRHTELLLRARGMARVGAEPEERRRGAHHAPQDPLRLRGRRAPFRSGPATRLVDVRHRRRRAHRRGTGRRDRRDRARDLEERLPLDPPGGGADPPRRRRPTSAPSVPGGPLAQGREDALQAGVEVKTGVMVKQIDQQGLVLQHPNGAGTERVEARTVLWAGGVTVPPFAKVLAKRANAATDRTGKLNVGADLTIPGHPDIFVIGDLATGADGKPFQGVAQVAMQQGTYAGRVIARRLRGKKPLPPFKYFDKGTMAVIGRAAAVANVFGVHLAGLPAWLIWSLIPIMYLVQFQSRLVVFLKWAIQDLTFNRGSRLITGQASSDFNFDREVARATAAALAPAPQAETKAPASAGAKT